VELVVRGVRKVYKDKIKTEGREQSILTIGIINIFT
jgi:hypothetical protein